VIADPADGWNVEIASAVQDACAENSNLSHVEFRFPDNGHQTLTVDINGVLIGMFHGHQAGRDVGKYLSNQAMGQTSLGMADIWISGHFHHFKLMDVGHRLWIQAPTVDPGSEWFRDRHGSDAPTGVLTLVVGEDYDPRKDVSIVRTA
jgi:predicted phosphodiesterase